MSRSRIVGGTLLFGLFIWFSSLPIVHTWDLVVSTWLQHAAPMADLPAGVLVLLGNAEVEIAAAAVVGAFLLRAQRDGDRGRTALRIGVGLAVASLTAVILKHLIVHPGPSSFLWRPTWRMGIQLHTPYSFPSGHTLRATLIAATLLQRTPVLAGGLVLAMMTALVYLGDHWTTDVLGGLCLGWTFSEGFRRLILRERGSSASAASPGRPR